MILIILRHFFFYVQRLNTNLSQIIYLVLTLSKITSTFIFFPCIGECTIKLTTEKYYLSCLFFSDFNDMLRPELLFQNGWKEAVPPYFVRHSFRCFSSQYFFFIYVLNALIIIKSFCVFLKNHLNWYMAKEILNPVFSLLFWKLFKWIYLQITVLIIEFSNYFIN